MLPLLPLWGIIVAVVALIGAGSTAAWYWLSRGRPPSEARDKARILVLGPTGVGKSTLINAIAGANLAPVGEGAPKTPRTEWLNAPEHPVWFGDTKGFEVIEAADQAKHLGKIAEWPESERPHVVWVCVRQDSDRVLDPEVAASKAFHEGGLPVLVLLTQADTSGAQRDKMLSKLRERMPFAHAFIPLNAEPQTYNGTVTVPRHGLDALRTETLSVLPPALRTEVEKAWC